MFDFSQMLAQYAQPITLVEESPGSWDLPSGQWIPGATTETTITAPVLPLSREELQYDQLGYTTADRKIYLHQRIDKGQKILIDGIEFKVMATSDYSFHASGLRIYIVRRADS